MRPEKPRADHLLANKGFAPTPSAAAALVLSGRVLVIDKRGHERRLEKPGERLDPAVQFRLKGESRTYVSRAGHKLAAALQAFDIRVKSRVCLDLGLSTGGFTDCLLQNGAARVHGVDVAYGTVDWRLRQDPRLVLHERTNARHLQPEHLGEFVELAVLDLSFIGLGAIWPVLPPLLSEDAEIVALVKPQFEVSRHLAEGGIVSDDGARLGALETVRKSAKSSGLVPHQAIDAPISGRSGNREMLLHLRKS